MQALGDSHRQQLVMQMFEGKPKTVTELSRHMNIARPTVSHHIKILKEAGLLSEERVGMKRYYRPAFGKYIDPMLELNYAMRSLVEWQQTQNKNIKDKV